jgi:hypothetical protein
MEKIKHDENRRILRIKYVHGIILAIFLSLAPQSIHGAIIFSDTRERVDKSQMMLMFREAKLIYDSVSLKKPDGHLYYIMYFKNDLIMFANGFFDVFIWQNSTWKQISQNRKGGYNYGSRNFVWNNRIFSYGGYGYWKNHGDLIEFDINTGVWHKINLDKPLPFGPSYSTETGFKILSDMCYVVNLSTHSVTNYPINFPVQFDIDILQISIKPESANWTWLIQGGENLLFTI